MSQRNLGALDFTVPLINPGMPELEVTVPKEMQEVLEVNPHLQAKYVTSIANAVMQTLEHPETKMRELRYDEVKWRVELANEAIRVMYFEEKLSLIHCLDKVGVVLLDTLRGGYASGDVTDGRGSGANARVYGVEEKQPVIMTEGDISDLNASEDDE